MLGPFVEFSHVHSLALDRAHPSKDEKRVPSSDLSPVARIC